MEPTLRFTRSQIIEIEVSTEKRELLQGLGEIGLSSECHFNRCPRPDRNFPNLWLVQVTGTEREKLMVFERAKAEYAICVYVLQHGSKYAKECLYYIHFPVYVGQMIFNYQVGFIPGHAFSMRLSL
jgi:hypothetical protein